MTHEERIAALEQELRQFRAAFADYARIHQEFAGHDRMYRAAIRALIVSHPEPEFLEPVLAHHLATVDASAVAVCESEEHLQGVQEAHNLLNLALSEAQTRRSKLPPQDS